MSANLSAELVAALHASGAGELEVIDPATSRVYLIVDGAWHRETLDALRREQDRDAIAQGLAELKRGPGLSTEEARRQIADDVPGPDPAAGAPRHQSECRLVGRSPFA